MYVYIWRCEFCLNDYSVILGAAGVASASVRGHLMNLEFGARHKKWHSCDPIALLDAPVTKTVSEDCQGIARTLKRESRGCVWFILWLDCDREGETICCNAAGLDPWSTA